MGGGIVVHVEDFAAGGVIALCARAIPGGEAAFIVGVVAFVFLIGYGDKADRLAGIDSRQAETASTIGCNGGVLKECLKKIDSRLNGAVNVAIDVGASSSGEDAFGTVNFHREAVAAVDEHELLTAGDLLPFDIDTDSNKGTAQWQIAIGLGGGAANDWHGVVGDIGCILRKCRKRCGDSAHSNEGRRCDDGTKLMFQK